MRVRCRAAAEPRSDALGLLELEITAEGLWLVYHSVRRYREGYAPGPAAEPTEHRVPWQAVTATRVGSDHLRLEVREPLSPFSHFYLGDFAQAEPASWIARARPWARLSSPQVVLTEFCHELATHLGAPLASEVALPTSTAGGLFSRRRFPRAWAGFAILSSSAGLAALLLQRAPQPPRAEASPGSSLSSLMAASASAIPDADGSGQPGVAPSRAAALPPAPSPAEAPDLPPPVLGNGCECIRHESVLWQRAPARLTALVTKRQSRTHGTHQHLEIELQVVNNSDRPLSALSFGVRFQIAQPGPSGSDDAPVERTLALPSPLGPGERVRWTVEGRGDRYELRLPDLGRLDEDGLDTAPADAFLALARSGNGLSSMHAGMMLAFLGDTRAREVLLKLREGAEVSQLEYLDRLLDSTMDLRVCQLHVSAVGSATRVQSCLYNAAERSHANIELKLRALQPTPHPEDPGAAPPRALAEETLAWSGPLAPHRGRRLELTFHLPRSVPSDRWIELHATHKESR
jgi:hypothetical protein